MDDNNIWNSFTVNGNTYDPNRWTIERGNDVAAIMNQDGGLIDEPPDENQSDAALIRWGIIWLMFRRTDAGCTADGRDIISACLAD